MVFLGYSFCCFKAEIGSVHRCYLSVVCSRSCWVFECSVRFNSSRLSPLSGRQYWFSPVFPAWHVGPYSSCLVILLHQLETQNWGSQAPSAWASSASRRMMWPPWNAAASHQPFDTETVYPQHLHEAYSYLSPGRCISPAAFLGSTCLETLSWDLMPCVVGKDPTQKLDGCGNSMAELMKAGLRFCLPSSKCLCLDPG